MTAAQARYASITSPEYLNRMKDEREHFNKKIGKAAVNGWMSITTTYDTKPSGDMQRELRERGFEITLIQSNTEYGGRSVDYIISWEKETGQTQDVAERDQESP